MNTLISNRKYDKFIKEVELVKVNLKKISSKFSRLNRHDILTISESKKFIVPPSKTNSDIIYFGKMFDIGTANGSYKL